MRLLPSFGLLFTFTLGACTGESQSSKAVPPAAKASPAVAKSEAPASTLPAAAALQPKKEAAPLAKAAPSDPAQAAAARDKFAEQDTAGVKLAERLQTKDLDEHADHNHGAESDPDHDHGHEASDHDASFDEELLQDGSALLPEAQAKRFQGRMDLVDGIKQSHDLGKLRQGEMMPFDFPFVSAGSQPLIVTGVKPSCGCTKAEIVLVEGDGTRKPYVKGTEIPVGQKFVLESEISTDGKPGGPFNAQISIYSNDIRGAFNVRLTADIEPILKVTPGPNVIFERMSTADVVEQTVTVSSVQGEPFLLSLAQEVVQDPLRLEFAPTKTPDESGKSNEWSIKVGMGPNAKIGMNSFPLAFKTDIPIAHPKYPSQDGTPQVHRLMVNVQAQVTGMVRAEPGFLTFGMVRPGESVERSFRLECQNEFQLKADIPVVLEGLQGQEFPYADALAVTIEPLEGGKSASVKVVLKGMPADTNGSFGGVIKIQVGHPSMPELDVRFSGVCRPSLPTPAAGPEPHPKQQ